ncbi:MAG TPA: hypothetical protein VMB21_14555 [Candidatus Limnocylindria bacterium]|jgi:hypothetical protein|nr:hypothetical protein [Candidatus Limnocylindria bacterium]
MNLLGSPIIMAACGIPDRMFGPMLALFLGLMAAAGAMTWLGGWLVARGWQTRRSAQEVAYLIVDGIICAASGWFWTMVTVASVPQ